MEEIDRVIATPLHKFTPASNTSNAINGQMISHAPSTATQTPGTN